MTKEYSAYLEHHGIKGQKWGVRRYQNEDGSLTKKGKKRLAKNYTDIRDRHRQEIMKLEYGKKKFKNELSADEIKQVDLQLLLENRNQQYADTMRQYFEEKHTKITLKDAQEVSRTAEKFYSDYYQNSTGMSSARKVLNDLWKEMEDKK